MIVVALSTVTLVADTPPIMTPVAPVKFVPVMVTAVPPVVAPLLGEMDVTAGAGELKTEIVMLWRSSAGPQLQVSVPTASPMSAKVLFAYVMLAATLITSFKRELVGTYISLLVKKNAKGAPVTEVDVA